MAITEMAFQYTYEDPYKYVFFTSESLLLSVSIVIKEKVSIGK